MSENGKLPVSVERFICQENCLVSVAPGGGRKRPILFFREDDQIGSVCSYRSWERSAETGSTLPWLFVIQRCRNCRYRCQKRPAETRSTLPRFSITLSGQEASSPEMILRGWLAVESAFQWRSSYFYIRVTNIWCNYVYGGDSVGDRAHRGFETERSGIIGAALRSMEFGDRKPFGFPQQFVR